MNSKQEYAYKWTLKDQDGGFRTVQADTVEEVIKNMDMLELAIKLRNTTVEPEKPVSTQPSEPQKDDLGDYNYCGIHKIALKERAGKDGGTYFDHRKNFGTEAAPDWDICYGRGFKKH